MSRESEASYELRDLQGRRLWKWPGHRGWWGELE
jgi:hypothetical protein